MDAKKHGRIEGAKIIVVLYIKLCRQTLVSLIWAFKFETLTSAFVLKFRFDRLTVLRIL